MTERRSPRLRSRALANATRGLGGSLPLALTIPLLAHRLSTADFAIWVLTVQVAAYVNYLELGVQTAVARTVAFRTSAGGLASAAGAIAAGVRMLLMAGLAGLGVIALAAVLLPHVVDIPPDREGVARASLLALGGAAAIALPGAAAHGALIGSSHHWLSALTVVGSRTVSVVATVIGAYSGWSVLALACCVASGTLMNGVGPFVIARLAGFPSPRVTPSATDRTEVRGLTTTVATWTVATLIISGIDVVVVGIVDYARVASYGLAVSAAAIVTAGYGVLFSAVIPAFADQAARADHTGATRLLARTVSLSCALLASGLVIMLATRTWFVGRWAASYADDTLPVYVVLMSTAAIRLAISPLGTFVMGYGRHRAARMPAIVESVLNLTLSIVLGIRFGAIGVAVASLVASTSAVAMYLVAVGPDSVGRADFRRYVLRAYLRSALAVAPIVVVLLLDVGGSAGAAIVVLAGIGLQFVTLRANLARLAPLGASVDSNRDTSPPGECNR